MTGGRQKRRLRILFISLFQTEEKVACIYIPEEKGTTCIDPCSYAARKLGMSDGYSVVLEDLLHL